MEPTRMKNMYAATSAFESVNGMAGVTPQTPATAYGVQNASAIYLHIHETSAKRIQTLDYLRKGHEGRVYWFNTIHFTRADVSRLPYFEKRKLARRAINYLLLGLSVPPILDVSSNPFEYLRSFNALLIEFEAFQQIHPGRWRFCIDSRAGANSTNVQAINSHWHQSSASKLSDRNRTAHAIKRSVRAQSNDGEYRVCHECCLRSGHLSIHFRIFRSTSGGRIYLSLDPHTTLRPGLFRDICDIMRRPH
ncbi:hypothetical protein CIHG_04769 [Coccidioides immitis H538.4]|uniref:Uncharacterized protein n=1 Tax=Coccidioides immitis H538.4 TaxID=396776 RepID=A0A0J8RTM8_COCIT|nr:hypothetical protein CIHG_04769 [Coccidioides immitis H538.4]